jgi:hypothetical protein
MADLSSEQMRTIIERVTAQVSQEVTSNDATGFVIADIHPHVAEFGKVGGASGAWKISYETTSAAVAAKPDAAKVSSAQLWKISYET